MSVFVIADLHLSTNSNKSMEVFGARWQNYTSRLQNNWNRVVTNNDIVIVPGDISWALTLEEAVPDLKFLDALNGRKIIGKGNHDFWWSTISKINTAFRENGITSVDVLYNNAYDTGSIIICGTRGWYVEPSRQNAENSPDYQKIVNREAIRLRLSLDAAAKLRAKVIRADESADSGLKLKTERESEREIVPFLHFPPVWNGFVCREITDVLAEYEIKRCYFGHIHSNYTVDRRFAFDNVMYELISSDFIDFTPQPVFP